MSNKKETYYHISEKIDKTFLAGLPHEKLNERLKEAYLGIIVNHDTIANPLVDIPMFAQENFNEYLVYLMSRPEYFYFIIKVMFGMESFPLQCITLKELYTHKFPMLIAARGFGKTQVLGMYTLIRMITTPGIKCVLTGAGFRQAKLIFEVMEGIWHKAPMLQNCFKGSRNGPHHGTDAWSFRLGDSVCWALPIGHDGSKIRGYRSNLLVCVDRNTLVQTDVGLVKIVDYMRYDCDKLLNMDNNFERPSNVIKTQKIDVYEIKTDYGYSIKCSSMHRLLATDGSKSYWKLAKDLTTEDYVELDNNDYFPEKYVEKDGFLIDEDISFDIENLSEIPQEILSSPRSVVFEFLVSCFNDSNIFYGAKLTHKSLEFLKQIQIILLKFNIVSSLSINDNKYSLFTMYQKEDDKRPIFRIKSVTKLDYQDILYDFTMPESHSFCAGGFINHNCDEKASVQKAIFEEVISGFLSVSSNPVEQVKKQAVLDAKRRLGVKIEEDDYDNSGIIQNQLIQAGTAYYKHNHFYEDYIKWKRIIHSGGDFSKLAGLDGLNPDHFNWKDYAVMRVPIDIVPVGFMDMSQITRTQASASRDVFLREYKTIFCDDSDGFFKRSLIDFCTPSESNIVIKDGESVKFSPVLYGDKNKKYVYGIDPAYQGDNFAVVILEVHPSHRRVVHCWTTQASDHKQMLKDFREGKCTINVENQYYDYCARKIRTLMKRFPCAYIALDAQGGGRAIMEAFMDPSKLEPGEELILPAIDPDEKPQETDLMQGDHIIKVFKNTSENITDANHALKKDMESRDIIFPHHDSISQILTEFYDTSLGDSAVLYDTLDDCVSNIEELKNELSTITISETKTGKESFDTPEIKGPNAKKGRLRKDRYSALLMANWVARSEANLITRPLNPSDVITMGGYVDKNNPDAMFIGNSKLASKLNDLYS